MNKEKLLEKILKLKKILDNEIFAELKLEIENLINEIENREMLIPVIGSFSSGKSTFINTFIKNNFLPVSITPETSIATEIRYSNQEKIEAIDINENILEYKIGDFNEIIKDSKKYKYIRIYINSDEIKNIEPLILVDMPGYNSPFEFHNNAIINYLDKGVYYIFLNSITSGTIDKETLDEIKNIDILNKKFKVGLTKSDLRREEDLIKIKNEIVDLLNLELGKKEEVYLLSCFNRESTLNLVNSINVEKIYENLYFSTIEKLFFDIEYIIECKKNSINMTKNDIEKNILEIKKSIENIKDIKKEKIAEAKDKYSRISIESILNKFESNVEDNIESLITAVKENDGGNKFNNRISTIIKNTLISELEIQFSKFKENICSDISISLENLEINLFSDEIKEKIKEFSLKKVINLKDKIEPGKLKKSEGLYKLATVTFSCLTNIISPILEILVIFLPNILNIFFKSANEKLERKKIQDNIMFEIVPQIKSEIRPQLIEIINKELEDLVIEISDNFENKLAEQEQILKDVKENQSNLNLEEELSNLENYLKEIKKINGEFYGE